MLADMADAEETILALGLCSAVHTKEMYLPQEVLEGAHHWISCQRDKILTICACMPAACSTQPTESLVEVFCFPQVRSGLHDL